MPDRAEVKVIFFDVGDVLIVDCIGPKFDVLNEKYAIPRDQLLALRKKYRQQADLGLYSDPQFWQILLQECGIAAQPEDWDLEPFYQEVPGTRGLVDRLRQRGYRLAIITDDSREMAQARQLRYGYQGLFEKVIVSSHLGIVKPDERIFHAALQEMNVPAGQALFIDNLEKNIAGAAAVGMKTVLFTDAASLEQSLTRMGVL